MTPPPSHLFYTGRLSSSGIIHPPSLMTGLGSLIAFSKKFLIIEVFAFQELGAVQGSHV